MSMRILCVLFLLIGGALWLPACSRQEHETLTVLAGSELEDLSPMFDQIQANTGVTLAMQYTGTLDGAERLIAGEEVDLAWFSHGKYLSLLQGANKRILAQEKIMLSPVVLGVKESKANAWGWSNNSDLTWSDITVKASSGELRYAMASPPSSNSGFTALVGVTAALSGATGDFDANTINKVQLQAFFTGQKLTAGSSGWLAERYAQEQDQLDGLINYESVLLQLNDGGKLKEKLRLIYPREGIITADYPLMLLNEHKRTAFDRLVAYLRSPEFQQLIVEHTQRRSVLPQVTLPAQFPKQLLVELPFPSTLEALDRILFSYLDEQRIPSHPFFVLDISGSMDGDRLAQLKTAMNNLTGLDQSLTGRFARFRSRERVTILTFNDRVDGRPQFFTEIVSSQAQDMTPIRQFVDGLKASGNTAIFAALLRAYELIQQAQAQDPTRYYSIVLMTDGENTAGPSEAEFFARYASLPEEVKQIKMFTILFGEADRETMEKIATATGGRSFDGSKKSLSEIFKTIRGYQ